MYQQVERVLGVDAPSARAVVGELITEDIQSLIELLRVYRPGGWTPPIDLTGGEHLKTVVADGRGVILWVGHFVHSDLVAKIAFHRAGVAVHHLSHRRHGFSSSRLGMAWLNRVKTAAEDRFLGARVLIDPQRPASAMKTLHSHLKDNQVISISVRGAKENSHSVAFLHGEISIAGGAARLARASGAALLPVVPVRNDRGGFTVHVEAPLDPGDAELAYGQRLERQVLAHPGQWLGCFHL